MLRDRAKYLGLGFEHWFPHSIQRSVVSDKEGGRECTWGLPLRIGRNRHTRHRCHRLNPNVEITSHKVKSYKEWKQERVRTARNSDSPVPPAPASAVQDADDADDVPPKVETIREAPRAFRFMDGNMEFRDICAGWTPAAWATELRRKAERCERYRPDIAEYYVRWATDIDSRIRGRETV